MSENEQYQICMLLKFAMHIQPIKPIQPIQPIKKIRSPRRTTLNN